MIILRYVQLSNTLLFIYLSHLSIIFFSNRHRYLYTIYIKLYIDTFWKFKLTVFIFFFIILPFKSDKFQKKHTLYWNSCLFEGKTGNKFRLIYIQQISLFVLSVKNSTIFCAPQISLFALNYPIRLNRIDIDYCAYIKQVTNEISINSWNSFVYSLISRILQQPRKIPSFLERFFITTHISTTATHTLQ